MLNSIKNLYVFSGGSYFGQRSVADDFLAKLKNGFQELRKTFVEEVKSYLSSCEQVTSDERFSGWDMRCFLYGLSAIEKSGAAEVNAGLILDRAKAYIKVQGDASYDCHIPSQDPIYSSIAGDISLQNPLCSFVVSKIKEHSNSKKYADDKEKCNRYLDVMRQEIKSSISNPQGEVKLPSTCFDLCDVELVKAAAVKKFANPKHASFVQRVSEFEKNFSTDASQGCCR